MGGDAAGGGQRATCCAAGSRFSPLWETVERGARLRRRALAAVPAALVGAVRDAPPADRAAGPAAVSRGHAPGLRLPAAGRRRRRGSRTSSRAVRATPPDRVADELRRVDRAASRVTRVPCDAIARRPGGRARPPRRPPRGRLAAARTALVAAGAGAHRRRRGVPLAAPGRARPRARHRRPARADPLVRRRHRHRAGPARLERELGRRRAGPDAQRVRVAAHPGGRGPALAADAVYPARGIGELLGGRHGRAPPPSLARLLGRTRALILTDLAEPASTTALAARHGLGRRRRSRRTCPRWRAPGCSPAGGTVTRCATAVRRWAGPWPKGSCRGSRPEPSRGRRADRVITCHH